LGITLRKNARAAEALESASLKRPAIARHVADKAVWLFCNPQGSVRVVMEAVWKRTAWIFHAHHALAAGGHFIGEDRPQHFIV
jgi:hypothetical protein